MRESSFSQSAFAFAFVVLVDALENFAHVFHLFEEGLGNENRALLGGGEGEAVAWARVNFYNFSAEFVLLLQN